MRPQRLEVEGFSTFRERVCLDFDGLELVAFTGPTGAGKSTLIDAITFALYGSVARYEHANRVAPVIHQLANQARVRLDFEAGGRSYIATRVVRRINTRSGGGDSASTREARLELVEEPIADGRTTVLAGDVKGLNAAVEELLGLDFRQFTRTIVLPQGDFAAFLRDEQSDRDKLLQRLLDLGIYERMGQMARSRAKASGQHAEILADQQRRDPPLSDDEFQDLHHTVVKLDRARTVIEAELVDLASLDARLDPLRERVRSIDSATARLEAVELPDAPPDIDGRLAEAGHRRAEIETELAAARSARDDALATVDALPDKGELARVLSLGEQLIESEAKIESLRATAVEVESTIATLAGERERTGSLLAEADSTLRSARLAADAAGWTAALVVGEPCPVCRQDVAAIPDHDAARELEAASEDHRQLEAESRSIATRLAKAEGAAQVTADEIERQAERVDLLQLQLAAFSQSTDPPGSVVPEALAEKLEQVDAAEQRYRSLAAATTEVENRLSRAVEAEEGLRSALRAVQAELSALRDSLADLDPPPLGHRSLGDDYELLRRWAKDRASALTEERADAAAEGKQVAKERGALLEKLTAVTAECGIVAEPSALIATVSEALAEARSAVAAADRRRRQHAEVEAEISVLNADRILNDALGKHLRSGGFGSWLLSEALDNIVAKATVWLLELSNNQYSLVAGDKHFAIIDHNNADETRDVRTLSGGETFLASLALALALADSIAELAPVDSPRLESMFLDEGFGTLDPGTLDVVAGAIEELASTGRMIGIVTHVNDLAERMPARFEITKGPATSTVELVEV